MYALDNGKSFCFFLLFISKLGGYNHHQCLRYLGAFGLLAPGNYQKVDRKERERETVGE